MLVVNSCSFGLGGLDGPSTSPEEVDVKVDSSASISTKVPLRKKFTSDLRTIRESPETVYTVSYLSMEDEEVDGGIQVPEPEPATPGVEILEITEETEAEQDLKTLNERADRLCEELKQLNLEASKEVKEEEEVKTPDVETPAFKEIMRQYSDFIIIIKSDEEDAQAGTEPSEETKDPNVDLEAENISSQESEVEKPIEDKIESTPEKLAKIDPEPIKESIDEKEDMKEPLTSEKNEIIQEESEKSPADCDEEPKLETSQVREEKPKEADNGLDELTLEETLEKLRNFTPKKPRVPTSQFPDLSVEGETMARINSRGCGHYWRMPFRHQLFAKEM